MSDVMIENTSKGRPNNFLFGPGGIYTPIELSFSGHDSSDPKDLGYLWMLGLGSTKNGGHEAITLCVWMQNPSVSHFCQVPYLFLCEIMVSDSHGFLVAINDLPSFAEFLRQWEPIVRLSMESVLENEATETKRQKEKKRLGVR